MAEMLAASNAVPEITDEGTMAIQVDQLTKAFGPRKAVDQVTFSLPRGAFLSVFGPNGAGKTTLLRMLATLSRPSSGTIHIDGIDSKEDPDSLRERIGIISHQPMLYPDLTAEENLIFYGSLYGVDRPDKRAIELLDAVGLKVRRKDRVRTFSRGMTQRVAIARALINDPSVVLLDEPYSGLDPHAIEIFDDLIKAVRADRTFVMVSHDLAKGLSLCTHALVMAKGRIVSFTDASTMDPKEFSTLYRNTVGLGVA